MPMRDHIGDPVRDDYVVWSTETDDVANRGTRAELMRVYDRFTANDFERADTFGSSAPRYPHRPEIIPAGHWGVPLFLNPVTRQEYRSGDLPRELLTWHTRKLFPAPQQGGRHRATWRDKLKAWWPW